MLANNLQDASFEARMHVASKNASSVEISASLLRTRRMWNVSGGVGTI
jgi:hypothetical protein